MDGARTKGPLVQMPVMQEGGAVPRPVHYQPGVLSIDLALTSR